MREQTAFDIFLPVVQPPVARQHRPTVVKQQDDEPFLLEAPEQSDPGADRALWTKRSVMVAAWMRNYSWDLLDCAFAIGITQKALRAGLDRYGLAVPEQVGETTTDRPCSSCGRMVRATRFQRLCLSTAKAGADCGGSAELVDDIERRERKRKRSAEGDGP